MWLAGNYLICEDEIEHVEVMFVLGGGSFDRGNEAAKLYKEGYADRIVCLGENVPTIFQILDISYSESEIASRNIIKKNEVSRSVVEILEKGTSTKEESEYIIKYCIENNIKQAIVLSSKFHTRRISNVFKPLFDAGNIKLILVGAPSSDYSEDEWWKSEAGMIMVNNEYMKLLYYFLKY